MELSTIIKNAVEAERAEEFSNSEQLSLGELILKLEPLLPEQKARKESDKREADVWFDFEYMRPTHLMSWRGIYRELAIGFSEGAEPLTVTEFYKMLKGALGKTYMGYKGGDFTMSKQTPLWVANQGNSGRTAVVDILDEGYSIIIITKYLPDSI